MSRWKRYQPFKIAETPYYNLYHIHCSDNIVMGSYLWFTRQAWFRSSTISKESMHCDYKYRHRHNSIAHLDLKKQIWFEKSNSNSSSRREWTLKGSRCLRGVWIRLNQFFLAENCWGLPPLVSYSKVKWLGMHLRILRLSFHVYLSPILAAGLE